MIALAPESQALLDALGYASAIDAVLDPRGATVRCTPRRWTIMHRVAGVGGRDVVVYRKLRRGGVAAAEAEWHWLRALPRAGFRVSAPAFFARAGDCTVVATLAAPGRSLAALLAQAGEEDAQEYALADVVPIVRRLHAARLVFRDLYWQHLFATAVQHGEVPTMIDVERVLRPRLLWQRWVAKDLAGLVSSWPFDRARLAPALVRAYRGADDPALVQAVMVKAQRIAAHVPKFGA